jgi:hypothetical protein
MFDPPGSANDGVQHMAKEWTKTASFAHFGATLTNVRWCWSARTPAGLVVLALWGDRFSRKNTPAEYEEDTGPGERWAARPGNRERLENLIWARDHCAGEFRVVMAIAKDTSGDPREISDCFPKDDLYMRITYLNEETGQFGAVAIVKK